MRPPVYILATVRKPQLLDAALLVFRTLRIGFPSSRVVVVGNGLDEQTARRVRRAAEDVGAWFAPSMKVSHDAWVEGLITRETGPFWICDTDMVFFESVERFAVAGRASLAGRLEPQFEEEWTGSIHVERLHTCLMFLNAPELRLQMRSWMGRFPQLWHTAQMNLVRQQFVPRLCERPLFYDTCAGLWQAGLGGFAFTAEQNRAFEHLHCGTYADLISGCESLKDLEAVHRAIYAAPEKARGLQEKQQKYYRSRSTAVVTEHGVSVE